MSTLKTNNIEHLDASTPSIQTTIGGGTILAGVSTVSGALSVGTGITFNTDGSAEFAGAIDASGLITADGGGTFGVTDSSSTAALRCYGAGYSTIYSFNLFDGVKGVFVGADSGGVFTSTIYSDGSSWFGGGVKVGGSLPNNSTIQLSADGSAAFDGNITFSTSGTGIDFSATSDGTGTATSELLDDYEEGTWTPTYFGASTTGTPVYAQNEGSYTKTGRLVTCFGYIQLSSIGGMTGNLVLNGLPYAVGDYLPNTGVDGGGFMTYYTNTAGSNNISGINIAPENNGTVSSMYRQDSTNGSAVILDVTDIGATFNVRFTLTYPAA